MTGREWHTRWIGFALAAHVVIGIAVRASSHLSTTYALVTLLIAFVVVVRAPNIERVAAAAGYVAAAEVLWRMTGANIFWETGKYAIVVLFGIAMLRFFPGWRRAALPALYLAMFVPSVFLAIDYFGLTDAREPISFNLSGPLALAFGLFFFSQARLTLVAFRQVLWVIVLPILATATVTLIGTMSSGSTTFEGELHFATSGGYGPNQVSAVLGFGALALVLLAVTERERRLRLVEIAVALWFLGQALLTFSRGGVFNIAVAVVLALLVVAPGLRHAGRVALLLVVAGVVACAALFPLLNSLTDGRLVERYDQKSLTRRDSIIGHDLELFGEQPIAGAGLGVATAERPPALRGEAAHTEFTRMLAEQGLFGVVALGALLAIIVGAFWRARPGIPRALVAALVGWSFAEMMHSATRIALISYALGLAVAAAGLVVADDGRTTEPTDSPTVLVDAGGAERARTSASDSVTKPRSSLDRT